MGGVGSLQRTGQALPLSLHYADIGSELSGANWAPGQVGGQCSCPAPAKGDPFQVLLVPHLNGQTPPHLNFPEEGEEPFAVRAGFLPPPYAVAPREGSSRPALFLQVRVHQLPVNDPVHVILRREKGEDKQLLLPGPGAGQGDGDKWGRR